MLAHTQYQACKDGQEIKACNISNKPKYVYQWSIGNIKHVIYEHNIISMQDINTTELRERDEQSQTQENCFEVQATCYTFPLSPQ